MVGVSQKIPSLSKQQKQRYPLQLEDESTVKSHISAIVFRFFALMKETHAEHVFFQQAFFLPHVVNFRHQEGFSTEEKVKDVLEELGIATYGIPFVLKPAETMGGVHACGRSNSPLSKLKHRQMAFSTCSHHKYFEELYDQLLKSSTVEAPSLIEEFTLIEAHCLFKIAEVFGKFYNQWMWDHGWTSNFPDTMDPVTSIVGFPSELYLNADTGKKCLLVSIGNDKREYHPQHAAHLMATFWGGKPILPPLIKESQTSPISARLSLSSTTNQTHYERGRLVPLVDGRGRDVKFEEIWWEEPEDYQPFIRTGGCIYLGSVGGRRDDSSDDESTPEGTASPASLAMTPPFLNFDDSVVFVSPFDMLKSAF
ncbi:hypothetical protein T439DRAFT_360479 [Meredithblackwellia eburnea MCA 4105]